LRLVRQIERRDRRRRSGVLDLADFVPQTRAVSSDEAAFPATPVD